MKLFTIGDSTSQGVMAFTATLPNITYSSLIAQKLGLTLQKDYRFPNWTESLSKDIGDIVGRLNYYYESNRFDSLTELQILNDLIQLSEVSSKLSTPALTQNRNKDTEFFHNVAVSGFGIADAWQVTPELCKNELFLNKKFSLCFKYLGVPENPIYRIALNVLNPSLNPKYDGYTQLNWLETHATSEGGIENIIIWLGSNHVVGSVKSLNINQTPNNPSARPSSLSPVERLKVKNWNLWHPEDFAFDFDELIKRVNEIMNKNKARNWNVFIVTIPFVTNLPLLKGFGLISSWKKNKIYHEYYTHLSYDESLALKKGLYLTIQDIIYIDECVNKFNISIKKTINTINNCHKRIRYHIVDISKILKQFSKRQKNPQPKYIDPDIFNFINANVGTEYSKYDTVGDRNLCRIFSLDGIHPNVIGQGLIANEFLKIMNKAGVINNVGKVIDNKFSSEEWHNIFNQDKLFKEPITMSQKISNKYELENLVIKFIQLFSK